MKDDEVSRKAKRELEKLSEDGGLLNAPRLKKKSKNRDMSLLVNQLILLIKIL